MPQGLCASCGAASLRYNEVQPPRSPRIQHLLSINEPPLEGEQAALRATVFKGSSVLSGLDATISDVRAVLDALLRDRAQATANIRDATVILHSIRRLPEDILRTIFSSCVPPQNDCLYNLDTGAPPCLDARNPRWTLSQTCRRWRYVALTTPNLWSCIDLDFNSLIRVQRMTVAFKLGLNVERSRSRDLTIRIRSQWDIVDHPALAVLLTCVRRWKNVDIDMPANSFRGLSVCRGLLYSLRYLRLRFHGDPSNPDTLDAFEFAPNLSFLSSGPDFNLQHVPWSQITVYSTWGVNMHCVDVLKKMSNLKSLRVYCGKDALSETPVRLANLETLTLVDQRMQGQPSAARISECFNTLSTPALKKLVIVYTDLRPWSFPSALPCHLTTLEVVGHLTADHASFVEFLSAIPTLRHLVLRVIDLNGSLLSALVLRGNENVIAPFLSILDLRLSRWHSNARSELLVALMESRRPNGGLAESPGKLWSYLTEFRISRPYCFNDEHLAQRWQVLCDEGFIVRCGLDDVEPLRDPGSSMNSHNIFHDEWFTGMPLSL